MNYEKGEKLKDINELLDILRERKAYFYEGTSYSVKDLGYYDITRNLWERCHLAVPKKEKKK